MTKPAEIYQEFRVSSYATPMEVFEKTSFESAGNSSKFILCAKSVENVALYNICITIF